MLPQPHHRPHARLRHRHPAITRAPVHPRPSIFLPTHLVRCVRSASYGWTLDLQDERLIKLATALAPANLRVGGSNADVAVYNEEFPGGEACDAEALSDRVCLSPARWDELLDFARKTGLSLVFTLNIMNGRDATGQGAFNASNAHALLAYTAKRHPSSVGWLAFELGNEKEFILTAEDTADCFKQVRGIINQLWPQAADRPRLVGPAMNPRPDWLTRFLIAMPPGTVDAVSYHMYAGYGRSLDLPQLMVEPGWLDFTHQVMRVNRQALAQAADHQARTHAGGQSVSQAARPELWIGETAAAWASGTAGVCDGFVSGFWWLDQLSQAAATGHGAMCRQCLVGGNYSLLDQLNGMAPNPDYWSAWLWRQLVGTEVLALTQVMPYMGDFQAATRGYLSCTRKGAPGYKAGAVTLVYINQDSQYENRSITMTLEPRLQGEPGRGDQTYAPFANLPRLEYVLTPTTGGILSRGINLNGQPLAVGEGSTLPALQPVEGQAPEFIVPAQSYGFAVYPEAAAAACMKASPPRA